MQCPLCHSIRARLLANTNNRQYFECQHCHLSLLDPAYRLDANTERTHYLTHNNDPADTGYRAFLGQLAKPLAEQLPAGASGLDYGSGPTLSLMLRERGFQMTDFDPYFAPDAGALAHRYDFITCFETAEHFYNPAAEFERFRQLLKPGGRLGVLTHLRNPADTFADWYYHRDPIHVCFYQMTTMHWIAGQYGWTVQSPLKNVVLFYAFQQQG